MCTVLLLSVNPIAVNKYISISNIKKYCQVDSSHFQRGQIVGVHLAGASVTKTATLLGVSRAAVYKVMTTYIMGGHHQLRGIVVKNQN